jgi:hypothetical protein
MKTQGDPSAGQGGVRREESVRQILQRACSSQDSERGHSPRQGEAGHRVGQCLGSAFGMCPMPGVT